MKYLKVLIIALLLIFLTSCTEDENYITSAVVNSEGHLVLTYSDGTTLDQGLVVPEVEVVEVEYHLVNFYNTEGHIISTQVVEQGEDAFAPLIDVPNHILFDDWDTVFSNVSTDLNVRPLWHEAKFTVSFHDAETAIPDMTEIEYGQIVILPVPEIDGKTFLGWYDSDSPYATRLNTYPEIHADMNLYARFEDIIYTVTYHTEGGTEVLSQEALYGDILSVPEMPVKEDYFYNGWYYDQEEMMPVEFDTIITEDIDIYISWIQFEYSFSDNPDAPDDEFFIINGVIGDHNYVYVPAMIDGYEVEKINSNAFRYESFYEVYLPETITTLYAYSFADMPNLTSIVLPDSIEYVYDGTFYNSTSLVDVTLSDSLHQISSRIFENTAIESIVIPEGVTSFGYSAFRNTPLTSVNMPSTLIIIGDYAFSNTLITEVIIPEGVTHLSSYTFRDCANLTTVSLPESLSYIGYNPFQGASSLTSVTLHESNPNLEMIDDVIFNETSEVLYLYLPYKQETTYTVPETVNYIERYGIVGNPYLETIYLPDTMQTHYIGETFGEMESLSSIDVYDAPGTAVIASDNGVLYSADFKYLFKYPQGKVDTTFSLHASTQVVYYRAFKDNTYVLSVILNDGIVRLHEYAFENCTNLSAINFPTTLQYIYNGVFYNVDGITTINLPDTILSIGGYAFAEMDNLSTLTLNEGLTYLPYYMLENSNNVTSLHIPSTISSISYDTLVGTNGLTTLTIEPGNTLFNIYNNTIYSEDYTRLYSVPGGYTNELFYMRQETIYVHANFGTSPNIKIIQNHYNVISFQSNVMNMPNLQAITFHNYNSITTLNYWPFDPELDEGFYLYVISALYDDYLANNTWARFEEWIIPMY